MGMDGFVLGKTEKYWAKEETSLFEISSNGTILH